eukprot:scaffold317_cov260-Pinguiococcus_pyrenoidosus.AAC.8
MGQARRIHLGRILATDALGSARLAVADGVVDQGQRGVQDAGGEDEALRQPRAQHASDPKGQKPRARVDHRSAVPRVLHEVRRQENPLSLSSMRRKRVDAALCALHELRQKSFVILMQWLGVVQSFPRMDSARNPKTREDQSVEPATIPRLFFRFHLFQSPFDSSSSRSVASDVAFD